MSNVDSALYGDENDEGFNAITTGEYGALSMTELNKNMNDIRHAINQETNTLVLLLSQLQRIVVAAFKVSDFVPNLTDLPNDNMSNVWKDKVNHNFFSKSILI